MNHAHHTSPDQIVTVENADGQSRIVVVCEHASHFIPAAFHDLGLADGALHSHAAWDPGALAVARGLSTRLDATLIAAAVSRLVYDCNRPPHAPDAMPTQSEAIKIPGNEGLTPAQRQARVTRYYDPFRTRLSDTIAATPAPVIATIHSFTPLYHGSPRAVEIGILHDTDTRLADAMLHLAPAFTDANVQRNAPYGPEHGVTHTLKEHAIAARHLNVMIEIRNDLIQTSEQQDAMANTVASWLAESLAKLAPAKDAP